MTSEVPEAEGTGWEYSTPARKAAWSACLPFQVSPADLPAGTVPAAPARATCRSAAVRYSTSLMASALCLEASTTP